MVGSRLRLLVGAALVGATACGPSVGGEGDGDGDGDGTEASAGTSVGAETGDGHSDGADTRADSTGGLDGSGTDDDSGDDTGGPTVSGLCGTPNDEVLAIVTDDADMHVHFGDGSAFVVDVWPTAAPADANVSHSVAIGEDRIAVASQWSTFDVSLDGGATLRVFDLQGGQLSQRDDDAGLRGVTLGHEQTLGVRRDDVTGTTDTLLIDVAGRETVLPDFVAAGPLRADGLMPGRLQGSERLWPHGWMSATGAFTPVSPEPLDTWVRTWKDALLYRTASGIAIARPDEVEILELGALADLPPRTLNGDWLLLSNNEDQWARVSLSSRTVEEITVPPPPNAELFGCYWLAPAIDDSGSFVFATRGPTAAQAMALDAAAGTWTPVGSPVTMVDSMDTWASGATVVIATAGSGQTFCPSSDFGPDRRALIGATRQIVRPADGVAHVLPGEIWDAGLSEGGTCAAYHSAAGSTLLDVLTGEELPLAGYAVHYLH